MRRPKVYLLSIGINNYESEEIANLNGCILDIEHFRDKLIELGKISDSRCFSLVNSYATRKNIIESFRRHFDQLEDDDIAILHFSGHGSQEPVSKEYVEAGLEPSYGKNETIVCSDSRTKAAFNIADKEIRFLISEIQRKKRRTLFIGFFDCCHSGSMLRDDNLRVKSISSRKSARPIECYLEGVLLSDVPGSTLLPEIDYMSFSACSPHELAYEDGSGGYFTRALVESMEATNKSNFTSYSHIYNLVRILVGQKKGLSQNPCFEYWGNVNPFQSFLGKNVNLHLSSNILYQTEKELTIGAGSLHGVMFSEIGIAKAPILDLSNNWKEIGSAVIKKVYLEETVVIPNWTISPPGSIEDCIVCLHTRRSTLKIENTDSSFLATKEFDQLLTISSIQNDYLIVQNNAQYIIKISSDNLSIYRLNSSIKELVIGVKKSNTGIETWLNWQLKLISNWENALQLQTPRNSKVYQDAVQFHFSYLDQNSKRVTRQVGSNLNTPNYFEQICIPIKSKESIISYQVEVVNNFVNIDGLYFYLLHLDRKYRIAQKNEHYVKPIVTGAGQILFDSRTNNVGLGISDPNLSSVVDTFILLASEIPLRNPYLFYQKGFEDDFGKVISNTYHCVTKSSSSCELSLKENWMAKKLSVKLELN